MILRMVCPKCGENVQKVVLCNWDSESQEFLYGDIKPGLHYWCPACGNIEQPVHITRSASEERLYQRMQWSECNRASLIEEFLEDPGEQARTTEEYDLAERAAVLNRCHSESVIKSIPFHEFVASVDIVCGSDWAYEKYRQWYGSSDDEEDSPFNESDPLNGE